MKYLFLIFLLISGCVWNVEQPVYREKLPADIVSDLLIEEYEVRFNDLTDRCKNNLHNVVYVDRGEHIYEDNDFALGLDTNLNGEHYYDGTSYIWIKEELTPIQYNKILVHELIHAILACISYGDNDYDHNEPYIWCTSIDDKGYGCRFDGKDDMDSLEYSVAETVRYYSN